MKKQKGKVGGVVKPTRRRKREIRGPHALRRESTRRKVFEAGIACLHELGYAGTSTLAVAKRAGISRGALLKQFPTRGHLFAALLERLIRQAQEASQAQCERLPPGIQRVLARADAAWEFYKTPEAFALMEIALGARGDGELSEHISAVGLARQHFAEVRVWDDMGIEISEAKRTLSVAMMQVVATVRGLAIERLMNRGSSLVDNAFALQKQQLQALLETLDTRYNSP
jgi:AcrR family transcriptional regulator